MIKLAEIAQETGYSISVVSRALNPDPDKGAKIAPKTRELIRETARELGFRPNRTAEFLKRRKNPELGVFLPHRQDSLVADLVMGISYAARELGFPVSFAFDVKFESYRRFIGMCREQRNCGIITYPYFKNNLECAALLDEFHRAGGKLVMINPHYSFSAEEIAAFSPRFPYVKTDDLTGGRIAAERLLGHHCDEYLGLYTVRERKTGFERRLAQAGKKCHCVLETPKNLAWVVERCRAPGVKIGVFCATDRAATLVHNRLMADGIIPGGRVKLIGYDDLFLVQYLTPPLTSIVQPFRELGRLAVKKLVNIIYERSEKPEILPPVLVARETA